MLKLRRWRNGVDRRGWGLILQTQQTRLSNWKFRQKNIPQFFMIDNLIEAGVKFFLLLFVSFFLWLLFIFFFNFFTFRQVGRGRLRFYFFIYLFFYFPDFCQCWLKSVIFFFNLSILLCLSAKKLQMVIQPSRRSDLLLRSHQLRSLKRKQDGRKVH